MISSNVPKPSYNDQGVVIPSEADILVGVQQDLTNIWPNLNPDLRTPQGQLATTETAVIGDSYALFAWYSNQVDPAFNSGRMQDGIGRIYFMSRIPGAPTTVDVVCSGLDGVVIPYAATIQDNAGNIYVSTASGTISGGSVTLPFANATNGPIPCAVGAIDSVPYQAVTGWDRGYNPSDGSLGRNVESRSEFEARRSASVAVNANGILDAILGKVLAVADVLDAFVMENPNDRAVTITGKTVGPHSIFVCVLGGIDADIAFAIWTRKAPGCGYNGNTTVQVSDPNSHYSPPAPSYFVSFQRPTVLNFAVMVLLRNNPQVPGNALDLIQNAVINAFAGTDGGPRAKIGSIVYASRYYAGIASLGPWSQIVSVKIGPVGNGGTITASISGTTLTVTAAAGIVAAGQLLQDVSNFIASGTLILSQLTGTPGGIGNYRVSNSQTVSSITMLLTDLFDDYGVPIDQAPSVSAPNINLAFQI